VFDKTGELTEILRGFGNLSPERACSEAAAAYDGYLNDFIRSIKAARKGDRLGAHLKASASLQQLLRTLFAVNGYLAPYADRLHRHWCRLKKIPYPPEELARRIERILQTGDVREQIQLETQMEAFMYAEGFPHEWEDKLEQEKARVLAAFPPER